MRAYARQLDQWEGDIVITRAEIERCSAEVPSRVRQKIDFAITNGSDFALAQSQSLQEFLVGPGCGVREAGAADQVYGALLKTEQARYFGLTKPLGLAKKQ